MFKEELKAMKRGLARCKKRATYFAWRDDAQFKYWLARIDLYGNAINVMNELNAQYKKEVPFLKRLFRHDDREKLGFALLKRQRLSAFRDFG